MNTIQIRSRIRATKREMKRHYHASYSARFRREGSPQNYKIYLDRQVALNLLRIRLNDLNRLLEIQLLQERFYP